MISPATGPVKTIEKKSQRSSRIQSIDFLRGVVMVLMAIDHARNFLHDSHGVGAEDLSKTTPSLFFTRWVTHFCAPVFIFLVGTSTYLMQQKWQSKKEVSKFLVIRGIFLILIEIFVFRFCWMHGAPIFEPFILALVLWAIGFSMIFLAIVIHLPDWAILIFGLLVLFLHNLLSGISFPEGSAMDTFWAFFYRGGEGSIGNIGISFLYPVFTYFGLISLGYCLGYIYTPAFSAEKRRAILVGMGLICISLFLFLRYFNLYGDPRPWQPGKNFMYSLMAFLRATKYPVSLLYALMTLGPALLVLGLIEPVRNKFTDFFVTIGSVPMFYYILHLPAFVLLGYVFGFNQHSLFTVYIFFAAVVLVLYLLCKWYAAYKFNHPEKRWLKYI